MFDHLSFTGDQHCNQCPQIRINDAVSDQIEIEMSDHQTTNLRQPIHLKEMSDTDKTQKNHKATATLTQSFRHSQVNNSNREQIRMYKDDQHQATITPTILIQTNGVDAAIRMKLFCYSQMSKHNQELSAIKMAQIQIEAFIHDKLIQRETHSFVIWQHIFCNEVTKQNECNAIHRA